MSDSTSNPIPTTEVNATSAVRVDVDAMLASKLGAKARWVPRFVADWLKRTVHQDVYNDILERYAGLQGADFCRALMNEFSIEINVRTPFGNPSTDNQRVIIVSNHPLGGLDGIALIDYFTRLYGTEVRFVVNDLLMAIEPLRSVFLPVNKHGAQSRQYLEELDSEMAGNRPIIIFPAGLVSRKGRHGEIRDLKWNKMFVSKAIQHHRDVLPMHFSGQNSSFFYNLAIWRKRLFVPFNIEMLYLPDEVLRSRGKHFTVTIGSIIDCHRLRDGRPAAVASKIKESVYSLAL